MILGLLLGCTQQGAVNFMGGGVDDPGGGPAGQPTTDVGNDVNDTTVITCECEDAEGECIVCPGDTLSLPPEPSPSASPTPGTKFKAMAVPDGEPEDTLDDLQDQQADEDYEEAMEANFQF